MNRNDIGCGFGGLMFGVIQTLAEDVGVARERDFVLGQRANLVGAEHVHRAEVQ